MPDDEAELSNPQVEEDFDPRVLKADEFIVPASDGKGHSARVQFRMSPGMISQADKFVSSKFFPYESISGLYRHAIMRHFKLLHDHAPVTSVMGQVEAMREIIKEDEENRLFVESFHLLSEQVSKHLGQGRTQMAQSLLGRVKQKIDDMPPDSAWSDIYKEKFHKEFGHVLEGKPASLVDFSDEPS